MVANFNIYIMETPVWMETYGLRDPMYYIFECFDCVQLQSEMRYQQMYEIVVLNLTVNPTRPLYTEVFIISLKVGHKFENGG